MKVKGTNLPRTTNSKELVKEVRQLVAEANVYTKTPSFPFQITQEQYEAEKLELTALMVSEVRKRLIEFAEGTFSSENLKKIGVNLRKRLKDVDGFPNRRLVILKPLKRFHNARDEYLKALEEFVLRAEEFKPQDKDWYMADYDIDTKNIERKSARMIQVLRNRANQLRRMKSTVYVSSDITLKLAKELGPFVAQVFLNGVSPTEANKALGVLNVALASIGLEPLPDKIDEITLEDLKEIGRKAAKITHPDKNTNANLEVQNIKVEKFSHINELIKQLREVLTQLDKKN